MARSPAESERVEQLARKLCRTYHRETDHAEIEWGMLPQIERSLWRLLARLAQAEIRKN